MPHKSKKKRVPIPRSNITHSSIEFFKLTQNKEFNNDIEILRKEIGITDCYDICNNIIIGSEELESEKDIIEYLINNNLIQKKIDLILNKYNLSEDWFEPLFFYLIQSENIIINPEFNPDGMKIIRRSGHKNHILLELGKDTTLEEIKMNWPSIQKAISKLPNYKIKRRGKYRTFFRDYLIYKMHLDPNIGTDSKIALEIEKETGKEMSTGSVKTTLSRFKKNYG